MPKLSTDLAKFLAIATCAMLLFVAVYERNRSREIESGSVAVPDADLRILVVGELELMAREIELSRNMALLEKALPTLPPGDANLQIPNIAEKFLNARVEMANLRNAKLKLERERQKLVAMRTDIICLKSN